MIKGPILHIVRFFVLALVQGLIVNELELGSNIQPMIYLLFVLLLPFETPVWAIMLLAFMHGGFMDMFTSTIGLHISASVLIAFFRPVILRLIAPRDGYEAGSVPSLSVMGWRWFVSYAGIMVLMHHTWFFFVEVFNFNNVWDVLLRTMLSSIVSIAGIVLIQYLFYRVSART